jgi:hypothetical protein
MFCVKILPVLERGAFYWSIGGFFIICITILSCSSGDYRPAKSVFATWTNSTGVSLTICGLGIGADSSSGPTEWHSSSVSSSPCSVLLPSTLPPT